MTRLRKGARVEWGGTEWELEEVVAVSTVGPGKQFLQILMKPVVANQPPIPVPPPGPSRLR